ncbi:MAG: hypothetical protein EB054_02550 [Actinobacteria bacterium]|nr:hypothetical protein [Actinomycetota bacterium]
MSLLTGTDFTLVASVFIASAVESVEAVTIVLAAGTARNMRSAIQGAISALLTLALIVAVFGRTLTNIPEEALRFTIGILLFFFGMQWLRKATLRYGGVIAMHDEAAIFKEEVELASHAKTKSLVAVKDWFAFTMSYKGVFLEGVEVAFIVISFASIRVDSNHNAMLQASVAAIGAALAAAAAGLVIHKPLTRVPENLLKFIVGIMCVTFGAFWTLEGINSPWPTSEVDLLKVGFFALLVALLMVSLVKQVQPVRQKRDMSEKERSIFGKFLHFWYEFIIGDDWRMPALVSIGVALAIYVGYEVVFVAVAFIASYAVGVLKPR